MKKATFSIFLMFLVALVACGESPAPADPPNLVAPPVTEPDGDEDGVPDSTDNCVADANADQADRDSDGLGDACDLVDDTNVDIPSRDPSCTGHPWVFQIVGEVHDQAGQGLSGSMVQVCVTSAEGDYVCQRPVGSDDEGMFRLEISPDYRCIGSAAVRILNVDKLSTTFYQELELPEVVGGENNPTLSLLNPVVLFDTTAATVPAIEDPRNDGNVYTVRFSDGMELDIKPSTFVGTTGGIADLRSARTNGSLGGVDFASGAVDFEAFYGFWPEADVVDGPGYALRIPNSTNLPVGTRVEFYVLGGLSSTGLDGEKIPEGHWQPAGTGTVGATFIESDTNGGLPCFTWLGYKVQ